MVAVIVRSCALCLHVIALILALFTTCGCNSGNPTAVNSNSSAVNSNSSYVMRPPPPIEPVLIAMLSPVLNQRRQEIFNSIHPVGVAKEVKIHDIDVDWKRGERTNRIEDIKTFTIRYTVFWEGPITKDGYTKIATTYDAELERYTNTKILSTNGITNATVFEAVGFIVCTMIANEPSK